MGTTISQNCVLFGVYDTSDIVHQLFAVALLAIIFTCTYKFGVYVGSRRTVDSSRGLLGPPRV